LIRIAFLAALVLGLAAPAPVGAEPATAKVPAKAAQKTAKSAKPAKVAAAEPHQSPLMIAAQKGDADAQYQLGMALLEGHGTKADPKAALIWFELGGANGSKAAAAAAARAYETGSGASRNMAMAGQWWYRAATLGDDKARDHWVQLVLSGEVTSLGGDAGLGWIADLASHDPRVAMVLADAFEKGLGIAPNRPEAEGWLRVAALLHGDAEAEFRLGRMLLSRQAYWRVLGDEEWAAKESDRKAGRPFGPVWYVDKPAQDEDKLSQQWPGMVEGQRHLERAAALGHAEAQYTLGMAMVTGFDLPVDMITGLHWLSAAAAQGHVEAMMVLGDFAAKGQGSFGKDPVRAYVMYDLASLAGEEMAAPAREVLAKSMTARQVAKARQIVQEFKELQGL
jgi:TPR repeat protein